jgi:hypothetical protein
MAWRSGLAEAILFLHLGVIAFNLFGLIAVPLGAWRGWDFVRLFWWRALHLAALAIVALQALFGRACFLTYWQHALTGEAAAPAPLIVRWVNGLIYWPLPLWVFTLIYVVIWLYALALWRWVPPRRS